ncbi:formation of crista junctions protein 1 [Ilyonectria robusta]|uniref:formation of crista junctions protein 1 n=1 Tax=Ilyonectria robusta TaxID=1079257 RepID=UPI001E8D1FEB|nr:formation of crista junctions protein 1 [Ilyonectria robusta]KAH8734802.1 formation of crista junctions protein 1 [Ilyonectria robusta]
MLRTSLRSARVLGGRSGAASATRQWPIAASRRAVVLGQRSYAVQNKPDSDPTKPAVLPTSETIISERAKTIDEVKAATKPPSTPPTPPPKKKGFFRRLRNFVYTLILLGVVGFAGGVWYSRISDNFHDFFTQYVPFGEQAVLYLEEKEFKKKFPNTPHSSSKARDADAAVKIPAQSGASWRVADQTRRSSAGPTHQEPKPEKAPKPAARKPKPAEAAPAPVAVVEKAPAAPAPQPEPAFKAPEVNEPSKCPPLKPIDLLSLADAREPVIQDLVHMVNDLILVINADGAHGRYSSSVNKAKNEVTKVGGKLKAMKGELEKKAARQVRDKIDEFDKAATDLIDRVEASMVTQEMQWRKDFEDEMKKVRENYEDRVKTLLEREQKLNEQKLQNQLLEQAVALKKDFVKEVQEHVEKERESRLGKLNDLSAAVAGLEKLTTGWNEVVDSNLQTQQLHVAVEAVRASLEDSQHPRPFIKELVALREIAADDPVVNAAIASVNPTAYQRGVPTSSQLIDRFRRVANEVRKASLLPDEAGVASHASSWVLSHVMFKKQGLADGDDVESILTRTQTYLEEGDLDSAAREMTGLDGWAKTLSKDWLGEVRKVLEVQQALDVIATEARLQSLRVD